MIRFAVQEKQLSPFSVNGFQVKTDVTYCGYSARNIIKTISSLKRAIILSPEAAKNLCNGLPRLDQTGWVKTETSAHRTLFNLAALYL